MTRISNRAPIEEQIGDFRKYLDELDSTVRLMKQERETLDSFQGSDIPHRALSKQIKNTRQAMEKTFSILETIKPLPTPSLRNKVTRDQSNEVKELTQRRNQHVRDTQPLARSVSDDVTTWTNIRDDRRPKRPSRQSTAQVWKVEDSVTGTYGSECPPPAGQVYKEESPPGQSSGPPATVEGDVFEQYRREGLIASESYFNTLEDPQYMKMMYVEPESELSWNY